MLLGGSVDQFVFVNCLLKNGSNHGSAVGTRFFIAIIVKW